MNQPRAFWQDLGTYGLGYILALLLTGLSFASVYFHWLKPRPVLALVLILALIQIIIHMRCFLHISLRRSARDDLQLVLFSTLIVLLMIGGTLIILMNQYRRMM